MQTFRLRRVRSTTCWRSTGRPAVAAAAMMKASCSLDASATASLARAHRLPAACSGRSSSFTSSATISSGAGSGSRRTPSRSASGARSLGWTDKQGTRWKVGWLPLGGYVKFVGDMNPASNPGRPRMAFPSICATAPSSRPVWQRFLVVLAGPGSQFPPGDPDLRRLLHAARRTAAPNVDRRSRCRDSPRQKAGLQPGDRILSSPAGHADFDDSRSVVVAAPGRDGGHSRRAQRREREPDGHAQVGHHRRTASATIRRGVGWGLADDAVSQRMPISPGGARSRRLTVGSRARSIDGIGQMVSGRALRASSAGRSRSPRSPGTGERSALSPSSSCSRCFN